MSRLLPAVLGLLCLATFASAQSPQRRLPVTFSELPLRHLAGTTHPLTKLPAAGRVMASAPLDRMLLVLQASPEQEADLQDLLAAQHDPLSPLYRQWLSPQEFGARFGASDQDIDTITAWLRAKGLQVNNVANSRRYIEFSGVVSQVENAFHTEMRHYVRNGVQHLANSTDISIPEALAPVVAGIASLNDFHAEPLFHSLTPVFLNAPPSPLLTTSTGGHALAPGDFATIYNVAPLYSGNVNGAGQTIAVVGRTNFNMSDVTTFRSTFGLPANNPQIVLAGTNPGIVSTNEEVEALLDVEWSGAVAKNATVKFVLAASTNTTGGETLSAAYAVNNNIAPVISSSFGLCEAQLGSENQFYNLLWQQAAAQGISAIVAAGDNGSAGCDSPGSASPASLGLAVSGLASTPWNTAIGGTLLNEGSSPSTYWSSVNTATLSSALSYIPELVWNDSVYVSAGNSANNLYAGSGGVSSLYATPSWQTGAGVPAVDPNTTSSHHRYLPDVSLSAAGHDPYVIVLNGALNGVGGTSAGAPSFAGIMALVNQHVGGRQGNAASTLYALASQSPSAFHDVVGGTDAVPCQVGSPACVPISGSIGAMSGWSAAPAYDLATGLGSVNAYNLVTSWPSNSTAPTIANLSPTSGVQGQSVPITITGTNFITGSIVNVSGTGVTAGSVVVASAASITATLTIAAGAVNGPYNVTVTTSAGTSNSAIFTVNSAAPAITNLSPASGTQGQAVPITISGSNFITGSTVNVSGTGVTAGSVVVASATSITATLTIAANAATGTYNVTVVTAGGSSNAKTFTVNSSTTTGAPTITGISPGSGARGQVVPVTITGTNFISGATVGVRGAGVTQGSFVVVSSTQMTAVFTISASAVLGTDTVTVTTSAGVSNTFPFNVVASGGPTITNLSPASGVQGQAVPITITGSNFITGSVVNVSGTGVTAGSVVVASATSITATLTIAANAATGSYNVTVTTSGGVSNTAPFTVNAAAPTITNLSPTSGVQGQAVPITITGSNFITGSVVNVSGTGVTAGSVVVASATSITATLTIAANAATGSYNVTVTTSGGVSNTAPFTVNAAAPTITNLSPASGVQGQAVPITITGTNFLAGSAVNVSGTGVTAGSVVVASATSITATLTIAANAATGPYNVTVTTSGGISNTAPFTVNGAAPTITNLSPASGVQGQSVPITITGTNFITGSAVNVSGTGVTAGSVVVASATSVTATLTIAPSAATGSYNVTVTTSGGVSNTAPFTVNPAAPTISNLSPAGGVQGQSVPITITGTNFITGSTVNVSGTGVTAGSVVVASPTSITATLTIAPNAATGPYNVTVTTSGGVSNTAPFTVNPAAPTITNLSPTSGVQGQSVPITITGTNFITGSTVNVSGTGVTAGSVVVASPTSITATLTIAPNAATGPYNVTVTTAGGVSNAAPFTVNPAAPTITNLSPTSGVQGQSVPITITGTNFITGSTVNVSGTGVTAGSVVVASPTSITATLTIAPNAATGSYNVTVTTAGGVSNIAPFTVNPVAVGAPTITSISPPVGNRGTVVTITITGTNFVPGATVGVRGVGVTQANFVVINSTTMTAVLTIGPNAVLGNDTVTVKTSAGASNGAPFTIQ